MKTIKEIAYEKYQLNWMANHGYSIHDIINKMDELWKDEDEKEKISHEMEYDRFLYDTGFIGSLWCCYDEFLNEEYADRDYMEFLLSDVEYKLYLLDVEEINVTDKELAVDMHFYLMMREDETEEQAIKRFNNIMDDISNLADHESNVSVHGTEVRDL